jgi:RNA polymerase sigma-70 factor (ECF subfamily)
VNRHRAERAGAAARTDPDLLRDIADGDLGALGALYDRYARDVWRAVHRTLGRGADQADVEDVVHTMFLKLPGIARAYDGRDSCRGWLCGIGVRIALRHWRGIRRFRRALSNFAETPTARAPADPEQRATGNEALAVLGRALDRMSAKKRAAFVLVELEGLRPEEAARALEIPIATVRTRLFHARNELRLALEEGGFP